jgi:hypothetical protein
MAYESEPVTGENISRVFQDVQTELENLKKLVARFVFLRGDQFIERTTEDFGAVIGEGRRPGFSLASSRSVTSGVPGTVVDTQVTIDGTAILRNMTFICQGNQPAIVVRSTAHCILDGCHVVKSDGTQSGATDQYIEVESGGQINIVSCMFHGSQSSGFVVNNAGAGANADVTGCVNLTGRAHNNVTVVGEVP